MLFSYTYVPHEMERMQEFIDFIFSEIWCKATNQVEFHFDLFEANTDYEDIMKQFFYADTEAADFFYGCVEGIYKVFSSLSRQKIELLKQWYQTNNAIEDICSNNNSIQFTRYSDVQREFPDLYSELSRFFKGLYSKKILTSAVLRKKMGSIDEHYKAFVAVNNLGKCPFCGISDLFGINHSKREAYDHYLPKSIYPFNTLNFYNLVPACHDCNSSYKTTKDPVLKAKGAHRRKAFYPYCSAGHKIDIQIDLANTNIDQLTPSEIMITFGPEKVREQIDTWRDVYSIDERFKAKCLGKTDGKYWLQQALDESNNDGGSTINFLKKVKRQKERFPMGECNFLKLPFLEACERNGLLT